MKVSKLIALLLAALLLGAALVSCTPQEPPAQEEEPPVSENPLEPDGAAVTPLEVEPAPLQDLMEMDEDALRDMDRVMLGSTTFAFDLAGALYDQDKKENFVVSPFSAWMPLAALLGVTDEAEQPALREALQLGEMTAEEVNRAMSGILYDLTQEQLQRMSAEDDWAEGKIESPIQIANALFVQEGLNPTQDFLQQFADNYLGQAFRVDFTTPAAVDAVNQWASDNTKGLIPQIVENFDPATVLNMANAIYFSDHWMNEFDPALTEEDVFYAPGGETSAQFMYREEDGLSYYENDRLQATRLSMNSGANLYIILPRDGDAGKLLADLDREVFLAQIREEMEPRTGKLWLPKFKIESGVMQLRDVLQDMGIPFLKEDSKAITGLVEQDISLVLDSVVQKASIEVQEEGTTAAAVTSLGWGMGSGPDATTPFEMNCNKPFVFVLTGSSRGAEMVLFLGVVNSPEA